MTGRITEVQRASLHDGPGIRTTVFMKGCPLSCAWCHNPESISFEQQTLFYPEKCIHCGRCAEGCFSGARVTCGEDVTPEALLDRILADRPYYRQDGGVTFSGGEPMAQRDFLSRMIDLCHAQGIRTAVETSMVYYDEGIFRKLDLIMADLKIWDDDTHRRYCGVPASPLREHFARAAALGVPMIARTPVIPGIDQGIDRIAAFLCPLENVKKYELLPYHALGDTKRQALGLSAAPFAAPAPELMEELNRYAFVR